jgi:hypothetical protein
VEGIVELSIKDVRTYMFKNVGYNLHLRRVKIEVQYKTSFAFFRVVKYITSAYGESLDWKD